MQGWLDGCLVSDLRIGFLLRPRTRLKIEHHGGIFTGEKTKMVGSSTKSGREYLL